MAVEAKPIEPSLKKEETKVVPLATLIKAREESKRLREQLEEARGKVSSMEVDLKVARADMNDDDETKSVRQFLLEEKRKLDSERANHEKDLISLQGREREIRAKELATQYGIDVSLLDGEEDIEGVSLRLYADKLAEENKVLKEGKSPESKIYETGPQSLIHKMPKDMTAPEFAEFEKRLKETVPSR